jgi:hypothetical protein
VRWQESFISAVTCLGRRSLQRQMNKRQELELFSWSYELSQKRFRSVVAQSSG